ncbi:MAG: hypothetical protein WC713_01295 [Candidatus Methylomirabilota bacterium]
MSLSEIWRHRAHLALPGRSHLLLRHAAGETSPAEGQRVEAWLASCGECRRLVAASRSGLAALRASAPVRLTAAESAVFWSEVMRRLDRGGTPAVRPVRPGIRELLGDHPRLSLASAAAAVVLALGLTLGQFGLWGASSGMNGVEILSVEAGDDASVMLFQMPESPVKIIWVFEPPDPL